MGRRGPKPTPKSVLEARGSWRAKDRQEAVAVQGVPHPPVWLDAEAKREWRRLIPLLIAQRTIALIDRDALALLCAAWSDVVRLRKVIDIEGFTYHKDDRVYPHPAVRLHADAERRFERLHMLFGMSPAARQGMQTKAPPAAEIKNNQADEGKQAEGKTRFFRQLKVKGA